MNTISPKQDIKLNNDLLKYPLSAIFDKNSSNFVLNRGIIMFLRYGAENFHSFYAPVEINLQPATSNFRRDLHHGWDGPNAASKMVAMLGPNGSGKTTLLKIPTFVTWFAANSFKDIPPVDGRIPTAPHFAHETESSKFWLVFEVDNQTWKYELECTPVRVISESLYRKIDRFSYVFTRKWNAEKNTYLVKQKDFDFPAKEVSKLRENVSLISTAAQYGVPIAIQIAEYFSTQVRANVNVIGRQYAMGAFDQSSKYYAENPASTEKMQDLLHSWDFGLHGIDLTEITVNHRDSVQKAWVPFGIHKLGEQEYRLGFEFESNGTRTAYVLLSQILPVLEKGGIAFIDEVEAELHPSVLNQLLSLFLKESTNPKGAQLVFTTHAIQVLDLLDKHQIIFTEKDEDQNSEAFSLSDIKGVRPDENYLAKYKAGAYGALPRL